MAEPIYTIRVYIVCKEGTQHISYEMFFHEFLCSFLYFIWTKHVWS